MSDLVTARSTFKDQLAIVGRKHTWITSFIYIGTFSSFIGYSAAFPPLIKTLYPAVTIGIAFLGAGRFAVATVGGWLADKEPDEILLLTKYRTPTVAAPMTVKFHSVMLAPPICRCVSVPAQGWGLWAMYQF